MPRVNRNSNPCDGCTLRRVKCEAGRPCYECKVRGIECTTLRARQKRGPKGGPRVKTRQKVEDFQRSIREAAQGKGQGDGESEPASSVPAVPAAPPDRYGRLPLEEYCRVIEIFRRNVYAIWPVINSDDLPAKLRRDPDDYESWALAASLCASTIAQLRLEEHTTSLDTTSSLRFAHDCLKMREMYDYRESYSLSSVLIPFFLHVYYANSDKLRTAGYFLRESVTFVHALELGRPDTYAHLSERDQSLRLRLYWLLLVTERTFAAQTGLPAVLQVIDALPSLDVELDDEELMPAFLSLMRLFAYLESEFLDCMSKIPQERQKLIAYQAALCRPEHDHAPNEAQRVDLFVTRQWVRLILWEHTARHYAMACYPEDPAFSLFLPVTIGHEMLSLFSLVTDAAIKAHGYGMELKVFRLADAMLDIVAVAPLSARGDGMLVGTGDVLQSLQTVLFQVGGRRSAFVHKMQTRMNQLELTTGSWPYAMLSSSSSEGGGSRVTGDSTDTESTFDGPRVEEILDP